MSEVIDHGRVHKIEERFIGVAPCPIVGNPVLLWWLAGREVSLERLPTPIVKDGHAHYYRVHERTTRPFCWLWDGYRMEG